MEKFVAHPHLEFLIGEGQECKVRHPFFDTEITGSMGVCQLLKRLSAATTKQEMREWRLCNDSTISELLRWFYIVLESELSFLEHGFLRAVGCPIGTPVTWAGLTSRKICPAGDAIFGIPTDIGGEFPGAREGPASIRNTLRDYAPMLCRKHAEPGDIIDYESRRIIGGSKLHVYDCGDVLWNAGESLEIVRGRTIKLADKIISLGCRPFVLGGDHSITAFVLEALHIHYPSIGLIQFDAHHDLYANQAVQRRRLDHGNMVRFALEQGAIASAFQIGLRTIEPFTQSDCQHDGSRLDFVSASQAEGLQAEDLFSRLDRTRPYYLTFDVDVLNGFNTRTNVVGGLSYYKCLEFYRYLNDHFEVIGGDFVEVGAVDASNYLPDIVSRLLLTCIFSRAVVRDC